MFTSESSKNINIKWNGNEKNEKEILNNLQIEADKITKGTWDLYWLGSEGRWNLKVEKLASGLFALESYWFKTEFSFEKDWVKDRSNENNIRQEVNLKQYSFKLTSPKKLPYWPYLAASPQDIIILANFVNFAKKVCKENANNLVIERKWNEYAMYEKWPFWAAYMKWSTRHSILYGVKGKFLPGHLLRWEHNPFETPVGSRWAWSYNFDLNEGILDEPYAQRSFIPFLNYLYIEQQKKSEKRSQINSNAIHWITLLKDEITKNIGILS
jgi:hypothetical protein